MNTIGIVLVVRVVGARLEPGRDSVEDAPGAGQVEVDDGALGDAFGVAGGGGMKELKFCGWEVGWVGKGEPVR